MNCKTCDGKGWVPVEGILNDVYGNAYGDCPDCEPICSRCQGTKKVSDGCKYLPDGRAYAQNITDCPWCVPKLSYAEQCKAKLDAFLIENNLHLVLHFIQLSDGALDYKLTLCQKNLDESVILIKNHPIYSGLPFYNGKTEVKDEK